MTRSRIAAALVAALLAGACSVSTPRNGFTGVDAGARGGVAGPGATTPSDAQVGADASNGSAGTAGAGSLSTPGSGAATGTGTGGAREGGARGGAAADAPVASDVGITAKTLTVSAVYAQSGPYGSVVSPVVGIAIDTWLEDVNGRGGINGRKVEVRRIDHQETSAGGVAACREAVSNGTFISLVLEGVGEANFTAPDCLDDAGIPNLSFAPLYNPDWRNVFTPIGLSDGAGRALPSHVRHVVAKPGAHVGVLQLTSAGFVATREAFIAAAAQEGVDVVGVEAVEPNQASFVPQLLRLRDAGADTLVVLVALEAVGVFRDLRSIGWSPAVTGFGWVFDVVSTVARNSMSGAHGLRFSAALSAPAVRKFSTMRRKQGRPDGFDGEAAIVYGILQLFEESMRRAGTNPTRGSWVTTMESIKGYDNGIIPPVTFGPGKHIGTEAFFPAVCCEPDFTWSGRGPAASRF